MVGNYGVAEGRSESTKAHTRAVLMREARGPAWTDWLHERGIVALSGIDTRSLVLKLRDSGALRAVVVAGAGSVEQAVEVGARAALDVRTGARARGLDRTPVRVFRRRSHTSRRRRLRLQALDPASARRGRRGCDGVPSRCNGRRAAPLRRGAPVERPGRSRAARAGGGGRNASCSAACRSSASVSDTSCSLSPPATRPSSSRLASRRESSGAGARVRPRARHEPEPRLRGRAVRRAGGDPRLALRRDGRGARFPLEHARSVQFHPEAGPGPHDAWSIIREWVEEVAYATAA